MLCAPIGTIKKRDCNLAVPLSEALVLPFVPNSNTVAHAVCMNARTMRVHYLHTNGHLVLQCFGTLWIYQIPDSQNKARKTPFSICPVFTPTRKTYTLGVGKILQNFLSHRGTIHFALQNYTKKMTLANKSAFFLYFYSFFGLLRYFMARRFALFICLYVFHRFLTLPISASPSLTSRRGDGI